MTKNSRHASRMGLSIGSRQHVRSTAYNPSKKPAAAKFGEASVSIKRQSSGARVDNRGLKLAARKVEIARKWLEDRAKVRAWLARPALDLPKILAKGKGFAKVQGILPPSVAEGVRIALANQVPAFWERAGEGDRNDFEYSDGVHHGFSIGEAEKDETVLGVARLLAQMLPGMLPNFSAARYGCHDCIDEHDDLVPEQYSLQEVCRLKSAYSKGTNKAAAARWRRGIGDSACAVTASIGRSTTVPCDASASANADLERALSSGDLEAVKRAVAANGANPLPASTREQVDYTRVLACAFYFSRGWKRSFGGEFIDLEAKQGHVPEFNTMVVFEVPHRHRVTAVQAPPGHYRYSVFGWWLLPDAEAAAARIQGTGHGAKAPSSNSSRSMGVKVRALKTSKDGFASAIPPLKRPRGAKYK